MTETPVGTAVIVFERGRMMLSLSRRGEALVWYQGAEPFSGPFATVAAALHFLKGVCVLHNHRLETGMVADPGQQ
ncbi:MAG: hypothetical protein M1541_13665 [Acidobacteria bacterium]|nr:hypothetical protein [Acidobacteriota bacterium]